MMAKSQEKMNELVEHDQKFKKVLDKLDDHDDKFKRVMGKLVDHDQKLEELATKNELGQVHGDIMKGLDKLIVMVQHIDQERTFTTAANQRLQVQQDKQRAELDQIKHVLNTS